MEGAGGDVAMVPTAAASISVLHRTFSNASAPGTTPLGPPQTPLDTTKESFNSPGAAMATPAVPDSGAAPPVPSVRAGRTGWGGVG